MIFTLTWIEIYKVFKKWRTYIGFIAIGVLVPFIEIVLAYTGEGFVKGATRGLRESFILVGSLLNGWLVAYMIMFSLWIHIPFLITLVAGDLLAGEGAAGTYRVLLTRPMSRTQVIISKYLAGLFYSATLVLFLAVLSIGLGIALLGTGELLVAQEKIIIFAANDVAWRFLGAYLTAFAGITVVASISFFLSSLVQNSIGPIIGTMAIYIILLILSELPYEFFQTISPYLFTHYLQAWMSFFGDPVDWEMIRKSVSVLLLHSFGFFLITLFIFKRKDILT
jgi:ABC-2 type transport system permease protein